MVTPQWSYYTDHSRDFVSGEAEVCSVDDFVEALEFYYKNKKLINKYGEKSRNVITQKYSWDKKAKQFYDIVMEFTRDIKPSQPVREQDMDVSVDIDSLIDNHGSDNTSSTIDNKESNESDKSLDEEVDIDQLIESKISEKKMKEPNLTIEDEESGDDDIIVIDGGA